MLAAMSIDITRRGFVAAAAVLAAFPARAGSDALQLATADGRKIAVTRWQPKGRARGTIIFSHGALSAPHLYERLIGPWVLAGYQVLAPLHVDSEQHPDKARFAGLASWAARIADMRALSAYVGGKYIAAGHSYGGLTALAMGGAKAVVPEGVTGPLADPNATSVIAFSPPAPIPVLITAEGYGALAVPALIQTGTADNPPTAPNTPANPEAWRGHLAPFDNAAPGDSRYGLILEGVDHYFGGAICRFEVPGPPQLAELAIAAEISALFARAYGSGDKAAEKALQARLSDALPVILKRR